MAAKRLSDLHNFVPKAKALLRQIGIHTTADFMALGVINTLITPKHTQLPANLNRVWAMEGAIPERDWRAEANTDKLRLLTQ